MKQCINCLSNDIETVIETNHSFYYCNNCHEKNAQVINNDGEIYTEKVGAHLKHVTVAAIIKQNNKILFINRDRYPFGLCLPTGHLLYNEKVTEALERTLKNKLGVKINNNKLLLHRTIQDHCKFGADRHEWYLYECEIDNKLPINSSSSNTIWLDKNEIKQANLIPSLKIIFSYIGLIEKQQIKNNISANNSFKITKDDDLGSSSALLDNLPLSILVFDSNNTILFSNNSATKLLNYLGKDNNQYRKFMHSLKELSQKTLKSHTHLSSNIRFNNEIYNIVTNPVKDKNGKINTTVIIKNITDQKFREARNVLEYQTSLALCSTASGNKIIDTILNQLMNTLDIVGCSLMLKEGESLEVRFRYSKADYKKRQSITLKIGEGVAGWAAKHRTIIAIPDTSKDALYVGSAVIQEKSILSVPVLSNNTLYGVLNVSKPKNVYFSEEEMKTITVVANRIALALENTDLYNELNKERNVLNQVLANSNDAVLLIDKKLEIIFANQALRKLFEVKSKKITMNILSKKMTESNLRIALRYIEKTLKSKKSYTHTFLIEENMKTRYIKADFNPVIDQDQTCGNVLIVQEDVTALMTKQKIIQKQMMETTALFKITSLKNRNNKMFYKRILHRTSSLLNSNNTMLLMKEPFENNLIFDKKINQEMTRFIEANVLKSDSIKKIDCHNHDLHLIIAPIKVDNRNMGGLVAINKGKKFKEKELKLLGIVADRIARKIETDRLILKIKTDKEQITNIINNSKDGIWTTDLNGETIIWNKAMQNITGFKNPEDFIKKNKNILNCLETILTKKKTVKEIEIINHFGDKHILGLSVSKVSQPDKPKLITAIFRDITKEIEFKNQQKEFLYTATHELRTPITAIKGYLSMIQNGDAGEINNKQREYFNRVTKSTDKLVNLVEDLLKVTRLEENKTEFQKESVNTDDLINEVINDFKQKANDKQLFLSKSGCKLRICADYEKTKQALSNIVDNSIKYTKNGKIEITTEKDKNNGIIRVDDTGVGIQQKDLHDVFKKFYRSFNSESIKAGGTGLGLYIVKQYIEKQGGNIQINSRVNKGTTFEIKLPLK